MALVNNQLALNTVYNHFLTSYAPKTSSAQDTHKKSELRNIYNSIVKLNKESPLYLIDTSKETQEFAVGLKENARELKNTISSLSSEDTGNVLDKKAAASTDEDIVSAKFIGKVSSDDETPGFEVEVMNLASPQVNLGKFLPADAMSLSPDTYSFDIHVNNTDYEFQFNINEDDTNKGIQTKLSNLLNRSNIGIESSVIEDNGNTALRLESVATGIEDGQTNIFDISDNRTSKTAGAVDYFGLDEMMNAPTNAHFSLNGIERSAFSNTFTVDKKFELTLNGVSAEGEAAVIGLKPDIESLTENVNQLVDIYNDFINKADAYKDTNTKSERLLSEMHGITATYQSDLDAMGLSIQEDGTLSIDEKLLTQTLENEEDSKGLFDTMRSFTNSLIRKSNQISLNPMNYVDKTVVVYKNPGKSFVNPYITSIYSGMMFNSYC